MVRRGPATEGRPGCSGTQRRDENPTPCTLHDPRPALPSLPGRKPGQSRFSPPPLPPRAHRQGWATWTGPRAEDGLPARTRTSAAGQQRASVCARPPERDLGWVRTGPIPPHTPSGLSELPGPSPTPRRGLQGLARGVGCGWPVSGGPREALIPKTAPSPSSPQETVFTSLTTARGGAVSVVALPVLTEQRVPLRVWKTGSAPLPPAPVTPHADTI